MLKEEQIIELLNRITKEDEFKKVYNKIYLCGYINALKDILEIKRPKSIPAFLERSV